MDTLNDRWYSMEEIIEYPGVSRDTVLVFTNKYHMPATRALLTSQEELLELLHNELVFPCQRSP